MEQPPIGAAIVALVEDDRSLRESLRRGLRKEGFLVQAAATGAEFLEMISGTQPDVMLIDVGLPDSDGRDVALAARARGVQVPVLFLSARSSPTDKLSGFASGGDDYVTKPFLFDELVARLRALTRRGAIESGIRIKDLRLDPVTFTIGNESATVALTPIEFRLIAALGRTPGVVRRVELVRAGWPAGAFVSDNTLDSFIARLRRKLKKLEGGTKISTVHRIGYRIE